MLASRTLLFVTLLAIASGAQAKRPRGGGSEAGQFDYYAVSLSWSPSFCATHSDPTQCGRGLGFVLHGLWPQFEAGYPQSCSTERLPGAVRSQYESLYPSPKLIGHEWDKHGTCSGLDPAGYFALSARLKQQVVIPAAYQQPARPVRASVAEFVQAFKSANPAMASNSVLPFCAGGGRFLSELHACFDKGGRSRSCSQGEIKRSYSSCRQETFLLESAR
ncbi:MAG: ribonuclease T2 family protein [Massilia sp.]